ncbi:MAG: hypothetical protein ACRD3J_22820, partial [Thermoanaerobaculia bacterium]
RSAGYAGGDVLVRGTGHTTADLAFDVWKEAYFGSKPLPDGVDTTKKVLSVLITRLRRELLTRGRRQIKRETVYAWNMETPLPRKATDDGAQEVRDDSDRFDHEHAGIGKIDWDTARRRILQLAQSSKNPLLFRFVEVQCCPEGFKALGRSETARLLKVTPSEVTNLQKSFRRILLKLYPGQEPTRPRRQGRRVKEGDQL